LHKIEVEQDGFRSERRTVTFDKDVELSIELKAAAGRPYAVSRPTTKPAATTEPAPAVTTAPKPEEDPGKKKPKPTVELDEQNPYKKKP
jgi:hypothetical protein